MMRMKLILVLVLFHCVLCKENERQCFGKICLQNGYQKWKYDSLLPRPFEVQIETKIFDVSKVDTSSNSVILDLAIKLYWTDNRVSCRERDSSFCLEVDENVIAKVWKPTIYIEKLKMFKVKKLHRVVEDLGVEVDSVKNLTKLFYYSEAELTLSCPMRFLWYPFDKQTCRINMFELNIEPIEEFRLLMHKNTDFGTYYATFQPANRDYTFSIDGAHVRNFSYANFNIEGMSNR